MVNGLLSITDMVDVGRNETTMTTYDENVVSEIMTGVTSRIDLITAIEKYNSDHKLPYNKRVRYTIAVSNNYISVLTAYKLSETELCVIGWDQNGYPDFKYNEKGVIEEARASLSTHIIAIENINDVVIGKCDPSAIENIFTFKTLDEIDEKTLINQLNQVYDGIFSLITSGYYRSAINKFNYEFKKYDFNGYTYEHKNSAYTLYARLYMKYVLVLKEIIMDSLNPDRVEYNPELAPTRKNKFEFVDNLEESLEEVVFNRYRETYGTPSYEAELETRKAAVREKTFTYTELDTFKQLIKFDQMKFNPDGTVYWERNEEPTGPGSQI